VGLTVGTLEYVHLHPQWIVFIFYRLVVEIDKRFYNILIVFDILNGKINFFYVQTENDLQY